MNKLVLALEKDARHVENLKINKMTLSHLEKISENLARDFDDFWNYSTLKGELLNENSHYIVLEREEEILGFGGIWRNIDEAHITNIVIRKDLRKQGYATIILQNLILITNDLHLPTITLEVNKKNIAAIKLYKKFNFQIVGERKKYYITDSALIMTRTQEREIYKRERNNTNEKYL